MRYTNMEHAADDDGVAANANSSRKVAPLASKAEDNSNSSINNSVHNDTSSHKSTSRNGKVPFRMHLPAELCVPVMPFSLYASAVSLPAIFHTVHALQLAADLRDRMAAEASSCRHRVVLLSLQAHKVRDEVLLRR